MTIKTDPAVTVPSTGFGVMPYGFAPFGVGAPASVADAPKNSAGSRYLNPQTGDYELAGATGQQAQMPPTRQRVLLAVKTVKGSSTANPQFGFAAPRKIGTNFVAQTTASIRSAVSHLTNEDAPVIRIERIDVLRTGVGRLVVTISYVDLLTGQVDSAEAQI